MSDTNEKKIPYVDRDVSWMTFNHRILQEARRHDVPLLERLNFLGIYSSNLDEFFRVRMGSLANISHTTGKEMADQRRHADNLFHKISDIDTILASEYADTVTEVTAELSAENIRIVNESQVSEEQAHFVRCIFRNKISGFISPVWLSHLQEFSKESDSHIYLAVEMKDHQGKADYAVIELPSATCRRFITLPDEDGTSFVIYLDDVVRMSLPMIFAGMGFDTFRAYSFKFTKDAEMELDNDLHSGPVEKIAKAVKSRKKGAALRLLYDAEMPDQLLKLLMKKLRFGSLDTIQPSGRYQNHKDFMSFPYACRRDLKYPAWRAAVPSEIKGSNPLLRLVEERDRFIHVPYQTFDYVVRMLQEAAVSKEVKSIKITLYRLAKNSKIVEALKCAARNGKKVTAVVELLARFDESSNIHYAREMQEAGINVVFGVEGLKIHSKIALITFSSRKKIAIVGTGNFHEGNAAAYTDYFLMTADRRITSEVAAVFDLIKRPFKVPEFKNLLVSPFNMRARFCRLIEEEIKNARKGKPAWIKIKINHITDPEMVKELYRASQAGVKVELLVRGNCSLVTGVPGTSEHIEAAGIIDRYLEHSRIFIFCHGGKNLTYIGSADWMPRNLDRRIEVITRIFDPIIKADLLRTIDYGLRDNTHARVVDGSGRNEIRVVAGESAPFRSQEELYNAYQNQK